MSSFEIALATPQEAASIAAMSRDYIETGLGWKYRAPSILQWIHDSETNVAVARKNGELVGFATMNYEGFEAHLILFAVTPQRRRQGIGTALIRWHIETAEVAGAQIVYVELRRANVIGKAFYESLGFQVMEELGSYYRGHEDGLRMALDLRKPIDT